MSAARGGEGEVEHQLVPSGADTKLVLVTKVVLTEMCIDMILIFGFFWSLYLQISDGLRYFVPKFMPPLFRPLSSAGSSAAGGARYSYRGCSDNVHFGMAVSAEFVDAAEKHKNQSLETRLMNQHNNRAGREVSTQLKIRGDSARF